MSFLKELDSRRDRRFYKHLAPTGANLTLIAELKKQKRRRVEAPPASESQDYILRYFRMRWRTRDSAPGSVY